MSNAVVKKQGGAVAALAGIKQGLQNVRRSIPASPLMPILRMGNDGIWVYGQDNTEIEEDSLWAVNVLSIQHGFVCWTNYPKEEKKKNELLGEVMAPMTSEPVDEASLKDYGWPWRAATSMQLKCINGEDEGTEVIYKPSSVGGGNAMSALLDDIEKQLDTGSVQINPIITLDSDHYDHKTYGKTYIPLFEIEDWMDMEGPAPVEPESEEPEEDDTPPEKPRKRKKAKAKEPEPEEAPETEEPEEEPENDEEPEENTEAAEPPKTEGRVRRRRRSR